MFSVIWPALLIPFAGTTLGAACVYFVRKALPPKVESALLGFAAGVMIAASVFSLLLPGLEEGGIFPAAVGFLIGIFFLLLLDRLIPHMHVVSHEEEGPHMSLKKTTKLFLAMTLHNVPEGMAVGIVFASISDGFSVTFASALALAVGIALQNLPEGAVLSLPLHTNGMSKNKAFVFGSLSGIVEPIAAVLTVLFAPVLRPVMPWLLCLSAGAMFYVTIEELIPESQNGEHSNVATIAFAIGFVLMMVLDTVLG